VSASWHEIKDRGVGHRGQGNDEGARIVARMVGNEGLSGYWPILRVRSAIIMVSDNPHVVITVLIAVVSSSKSPRLPSKPQLEGPEGDAHINM